MLINDVEWEQVYMLVKHNSESSGGRWVASAVRVTMAKRTVVFGVLMVVNLVLLFILYPLSDIPIINTGKFPLADVFSGQGRGGNNYDDGSYDLSYVSHTLSGLTDKYNHHNRDPQEGMSSISSEAAVTQNVDTFIKSESVITQNEPPPVNSEAMSANKEHSATYTDEDSKDILFSDATWEKKMEKRFMRRLKRMKATCQKYGVVNDVHQTLSKYLCYAEKYNLMVCAVPKVSA